MANSQFYGIFCDDVRHEQFGKITLVGCYGPHMLTSQLPFTLRNLCLSFTYRCPREEIPEVVTVMVEQDEKALFEITFDIDAKKEAKSSESYFILNGGFEMVDIEFEKPTKLLAFAEVDGERILGPELAVDKAKGSMKANTN